MLSVKKVAERLSVSQSVVYSLIDAGDISIHRIGRGRGTIRISESDLDNFLKRCRQTKNSRVATGPLRHIKF